MVFVVSVDDAKGMETHEVKNIVLAKINLVITLSLLRLPTFHFVKGMRS